MQHVEAKQILSVDISPILNQDIENIHISTERSVMESRELILCCLKIDVLLKLSLAKLLL